MAEIRQISTAITGDGPGFDDLLSDGAGGLYALRTGAEGLEWRALDGLEVLNQSLTSASGALDAPRRILQAEVDGTPVVLITGRYGVEIEAVRLTAPGVFGPGFALRMDGAVPGALTALAVEGDLYATATRQAPGLTLWQRDGQTLRPRDADVAADLFAPGDVADMTFAQIGGQTRLLALSQGGNQLVNIGLSPSGAVDQLTTLGPEDGLFVDQLARLSIVSVAGQDYALLGASGSGTIAVIALEPGGQMVLRDHVGDDQLTRFGGLTVLETVTLGDQVFVVAGGADDGVSVMSLLPGGRLVHLGAREQGLETALGNPAALSLQAGTDGFAAIVAGQTGSDGPGLSRLQVETGPIGATLVPGGGDDARTGSAGRDQILGGGGNDTLRGAGGDDILVDGTGRDVLEGGAGADIFVLLRDGQEDRITDFEPGTDRLDLSDWGRFYTVDALEITATATGARLTFGEEVLWLDTDNNALLEPDMITERDLLNLWRLSLNPPQDTPPPPDQPAPPAPPPPPDPPDMPDPDPPRVLTGAGGADTLQGGTGPDRITGEAGDAAFDALSGQVFRLYQAVFDRPPDLGGFFDWMERIGSGAVTPTGAAERFVRSAEFQQTYGALGTDDFVTLLYANVLGRGPDPVGFADWTGRLESGEISRAEVVLRFAESREFVAATALDALAYGDVGLQIRFSDDVFRLYRATLDRNPDPVGFRSWTEELARGTDFVDVIAGFTGSIEFRTTYGNASDPEFVTLLYANVLDRGPDPTGLADWLNRLTNEGWSREEVVAAFAQSREFVARTAADLVTWGRNTGRDDVLEGRAGDDLLNGGVLSDLFVFSADAPGRDTVVLFEPWDRLEFRGFGYGTQEEALARMRQVGSDVIFEDQGVQVVFSDTSLEDIGF
jgi:Ca2+-binding RTX toxin-like protein